MTGSPGYDNKKMDIDMPCHIKWQGFCIRYNTCLRPADLDVCLLLAIAAQAVLHRLLGIPVQIITIAHAIW